MKNKKYAIRFIIGLFTATVLLHLNAQIVSHSGPSLDMSHGKLVVSENHLFLQFDDRTPFFYLEDTGWEIQSVPFKEKRNYNLRRLQEDRGLIGYSYWMQQNKEHGFS